MKKGKKIYKYTSIISLAVVLIMLANLIIPTLTVADADLDTGTNNITLSEITYNDVDNTLTVTGSIANKYTSYSWYLAPGAVTTNAPYLEGLDAETARAAKLQYMDDLVAEFQAAAIETAIDQNGNSFTCVKTIQPIEGETTYKFLCVAKNAN
ncbi:MAG: hypothetical protein IKQ33_03000, partial [Clostridia bacterium]|nr:hypothetical protein [Clostridia bacterium]